MRATPRPGMTLRDLLPEEEAARREARWPAASAAPEKRRTKPLLLVEKLVKEYPRKGATATLGKLFSRKPPVEKEIFRAVDGISLQSCAARASAWSANPAAANPPPR